MLTTAAKGVYIISATPFHDDGRIDTVSTDRLIDFYKASGVDGMTILGMMGEAPKLDAAEAQAFVKQVVGRAGNLPVIVGVSAPGFAAMRTLAQSSMQAGAAGVMIAPPASCKTDDQIVNYYADAVNAIGADVPFVIQDYPLSTGVVMANKVIERIVVAHASCVMLKHEDWPGLEKITAVRRAEAEGRMKRISILTGNGGLFLDFEMSRGADGAMTGYAFPEMLVGVCRLMAQEKRDAAHDLFDAHLPLVRYEQQMGAGLAVRKYVLMRRGVIASDAQRKPGAQLPAIAKREVDYLLARLAQHEPAARKLAPAG
jgi:4-hydroxy-tetrahydrodipicolinate synthase